VAKLVGLTELELQNAFKLVYGKTVCLSAQEARLQFAHDLLKQSDAPLRVICEEVGLPGSQQFFLCVF